MISCLDKGEHYRKLTLIISGLFIVSGCSLPTSPLAGTAQSGFKDGILKDAQFNNPQDMALDHEGNIIVADTGNFSIRKVTPEGEVTTLAGNGKKGHVNGKPEISQFIDPTAVVVDSKGNIFVKDHTCIRKLEKDNNFDVTTFSGTCNVSYEPSIIHKSARNTNKENLFIPTESGVLKGLTIDNKDNLLIFNPYLFKITPLGKVEQISDSNQQPIGEITNQYVIDNKNVIQMLLLDLEFSVHQLSLAGYKRSSFKLPRADQFPRNILVNENEGKQHYSSLNVDSKSNIYVINDANYLLVKSHSGKVDVLGQIAGHHIPKASLIDVEIDEKKNVLYALSDKANQIVKVSLAK